MIHFTCDVCGKDLGAGDQDRYTLKMEVCPVKHPGELTEEDLEDDQLQAVSQLLKENPDNIALPATAHRFRFDLCSECQRRFAQDPLGKKRLVSLFTSEN